MPRLSARQRRAESGVEIEISPGTTVTIRRRTLLTLVMSGVLTTDILSSAQRMEKRFEGLSAEDSDAAFNALADESRQDMKRMLEAVACAVVIDPVIVPVDDGNDDHLPVSELDSTELLAIYAALKQRPALVTPVQAPVLPDTSTEVARETFHQEQPADVDPAAPAGDDLPPSTELVANGGLVDYVGQ